MIETNVRQFIAAARLYLFGVVPTAPRLATIAGTRPR